MEMTTITLLLLVPLAVWRIYSRLKIMLGRTRSELWRHYSTAVISAAGLGDCVAVIGQPVNGSDVAISFNGEAVFGDQRRLLQRQWAETSYQIQKLRDNAEGEAINVFAHNLHDLLLVHGRIASAFNAQYPREVYRFQRRSTFRVRPAGRAQPHASLIHPDLPRRQIDLRVLDISHTGVALMLNESLDLFRSGQYLPEVTLKLDTSTWLQVTLHVMHVSEVGLSPFQYRRIGCELTDMSAGALRDLQRYLDLTQKRHRLLTL